MIGMALDPVCRVDVGPQDPKTTTAAAGADYQGQTGFFCAPGCRVAFERDPEKYGEAVTSGEEHHHHRGH
jgi:YHS domain-containing protein